MKTRTILAAALFLVACAEQSVTAVPVTSAPVASAASPSEPATRILARERCAHAATCGQLGPGKRFASQTDCVLATAIDEGQSIGPDACPYGVDDAQVRVCVATLRAQYCKNDVERLDDVADCRPFELCRSAP